MFVHVNEVQPFFTTTTTAATLYTGEYVTFYLKPPHPAKAGGGDAALRRDSAKDVRGLPGPDGQRGSLMCDHGKISFRSYARAHMPAPPLLHANATGLVAESATGAGTQNCGGNADNGR